MFLFDQIFTHNRLENICIDVMYQSTVTDVMSYSSPKMSYKIINGRLGLVVLAAVHLQKGSVQLK